MHFLNKFKVSISQYESKERLQKHKPVKTKPNNYVVSSIAYICQEKTFDGFHVLGFSAIL